MESTVPLAKQRGFSVATRRTGIALRSGHAHPLHAARSLNIEGDEESDGETNGREEEIHDHGWRELTLTALKFPVRLPQGE